MKKNQNNNGVSKIGGTNSKSVNSLQYISKMTIPRDPKYSIEGKYFFEYINFSSLFIS